MSTMHLEAQKAGLVRDILNEANEDMMTEIMIFFRNTRKKVSEKKHRTTKERLLEFYGENAPTAADIANEIEWGKAEGNEIW
ncbi:hypothetical protein FACS189464_1380 [Bacteroidia bacterium]|nr:hypothetical protein FACS189464_1380 [Bacteroidia bacterium]